MVFIEGGTRILGGGYQFQVKDYYMLLLGSDPDYAKLNDGQFLIGEVPAPNNPTKQVTVHGFYISKTEVTNLQYREYLIDSLLDPGEAKQFRARIKALSKEPQGNLRTVWQPLIDKAGAAGLLPDTACWKNDFQYAYNEPLVRNYLWHKAFDNYPVVGVSWKQAKDYCAWLTKTVYTEILSKRPEAVLPAGFRLPTEMEWEWAALPKIPANADLESLRKDIYPWQGRYVTDDKGRYRANIKTQPGDYIGDNYEYTCPVDAFAPNDHGLYGMAGNAAEWCEDDFIFRIKEDSYGLNLVRRPGGQLFEVVTEDRSTSESEMHVVKGGSWAEFSYGAMCGSRMPYPQTQGSSRIGFRIAQIRLGSPF